MFNRKLKKRIETLEKSQFKVLNVLEKENQHLTDFVKTIVNYNDRIAELEAVCAANKDHIKKIEEKCPNKCRPIDNEEPAASHGHQ
ncbi:MAG: hypothetical protein PHR53_02490 [Bacteroidales bacterium]|nr:hypothetical protein [Bacteroidales bacterium]